jgi:hypothetical protein
MRASKVAVECHCSAGVTVQIAPAAVVIRPGDSSTPDKAAWLCPKCNCPGSTTNEALVTLLRLAGARYGVSGTVHADLCRVCEQTFLIAPADVLIYLGDTEDAPSMRRRDCPVCGHVGLDRVSDARAVALAWLGVRQVDDVLDLVPEDADALTDSTVDLHAELALALATPAPDGD